MPLSNFKQLCALRRVAALHCFPTCNAVAILRRRRINKFISSMLSSSSSSDVPTGRHFCSTVSCDANDEYIRDAALATDNRSHAEFDSATGAPSRDVATEKLVHSLKQVNGIQSQLMRHYANLPLDRRVLYRDNLLQECMTLYRKQLRVVFLALWQHVEGTAADQNTVPPLNRAMLRNLRTAWLTLRGLSPTQPKEASLKAAYFDEVDAFYAALMCSGLLAEDAALRLVLEELQSNDLLEPSASFYESVFIALWSLSDIQRTPTVEGKTASLSSPELVVGEGKELRRGLAGDLACHYMGHALAQPARASQRRVAVRRETWEVFFCTFAHAQPAPKLMDLWWTRFLKWVDDQHAAEQSSLTQADAAATKASYRMSSPSAGAPLPYQAVHAVLAWCAQSRDIERALKYFNEVNQRGLTLHDSTSPYPTLPLALAESFGHASSLTAKSTNILVQQLQLALLVKLMASTKSVKLDGGLRALVVHDVQRQIDASVLYAAPWGVLNDLLSGLSVPSSMRLLRRCSLFTSDVPKDELTASCSGSAHPSNNASDSKKGKGREIPFFIWASLLRRCCREHLQDQAESLFRFLRHKFSLTSQEKRELVEIMMRMYATMQPADFPSALDFFLQHVLRRPPNDPVIEPDGVLYELLIKCADSRNAAMMLFLEACANGVALTPELFESLTGSTQFKTVASLSHKLPHDYAASSLDAQLNIPAEADAHLRREEALRARGKPLYNSTGNAA